MFKPVLEHLITESNPIINTTNNIDIALKILTKHIQSAVETSSYVVSNRFNESNLPIQIVQEMTETSLGLTIYQGLRHQTKT